MFGYVVVNKPELKIKDFDLCVKFTLGITDPSTKNNPLIKGR